MKTIFKGFVLTVVVALFLIPMAKAKQNSAAKKSHPVAVKRTFLVSGTLVDQDGKLLQGVKVGITTKTAWARIPGKIHTSETKVVSGKFKIEAKRGNTIQLNFFKPGYSRVRKEYTIAKAVKSKDKNISFKGTTLTAKNQIIILRKNTRAVKSK